MFSLTKTHDDFCKRLFYIFLFFRVTLSKKYYRFWGLFYYLSAIILIANLFFMAAIKTVITTNINELLFLIKFNIFFLLDKF